MTGTFKPADRLRKPDVAARLSLSRAPVWHALRRQEADGIVEHCPRLGAITRQLSRPARIALYQMRAGLERTAAERVAKHAAQAPIDTLNELNSAIAASTVTQAAALNQDFHRVIYMATRDWFLLKAARGLHSLLMLLGPTTLDDPVRIKVMTAQHNIIIDAVAQGDAAAETHLETSLRHGLKRLGR